MLGQGQLNLGQGQGQGQSQGHLEHYLAIRFSSALFHLLTEC